MTSSSIAKRRTPVGAGKRDESRQQVGHLHAGELRASFVLDHNREVLAAIRHERERMPGVECQRRQNGADVDVEAAARGTRGRRRYIRRDRATMMPSSASWRRSVSSQKLRQLGEHRRGPCRGARESAWSSRTMKNSSRLLAAMPKNLARSSSGWPALACSSTRSLNESQLSSRSKYSDGSRRSGSVAVVSATLAGTRRGRRAAVGLMAMPLAISVPISRSTRFQGFRP